MLNGMNGNNGMMYPNNYDYENAQARLNMLERQNFGQMNNNGGGNGQVQMQVFKGRPVSNFYEANASLIDLDGSLHIFPDLANNRIYTKKITLDGTADLKTYVLTDNPVEELQINRGNNPQNNPSMSNGDYIGRSEFESHMKAIDERMGYFMGRIENMLGGIINGSGNQYGSGNAGVSANVSNVPVVGQSDASNGTNAGKQSVVQKGAADGERKE